MTVRILFLIIITNLSLLSECFSQYLYKGYQYCNSEKRFESFFNIRSKADQHPFYVLTITPSSCPRCEGTMLDMYNFVARKNVDNTFVVVESPYKLAAEKYMAAHFKGAFKYIFYDTLGTFQTIIGNGTNNAKIPVSMLYKFNSSYKLVGSLPSLGVVLSQQLIDSFMNLTKKIPCVELNNNIKLTHSNIHWTSKTLLKRDSIHPYSSPYRFIVENNLISFIDEINDEIYTYSKDGNLISLLEKTELEFEKYSPTPLDKNSLKILINSSIARVINLKLIELDSFKVKYVASLPSVHTEVAKGDTNIYYSNAACLVTKTLDGKYIYINNFDLDSLSLKFMDSSLAILHKAMHIIDINGTKLYVMPLQKGWPAIGGTALDTSNKVSNPFLAKFYNFSPTFLVMDENNEVINTFCRLPNIYKRMNLGYYASYPLFTNNKTKLFTVDRFSGRICAYDLENIITGKDKYMEKTLFAFDSTWRNNQNKKQPLSYFRGFDEILNNRKVLTINSTNHFLYVLLKDNQKVELLKFDTNLALIKKREIAIPSNDESIENSEIAILIDPNEEDKVTLVTIENSDNKLFLCTLSEHLE